MRLAELQAAMGRDLVEAGDSAFAALMAGQPGVAVYRNNYRGQLLACLRDAYEQCWAWLGDDGFEAAAGAYIEAHQPSGWTLDAYGGEFDALLRERFPQDPELAELAWLEWALRRAFDGADAAPVDMGGLGEVDWEAARFRFAPTLKLGTMTTNAAAIWSALAEGVAPPGAEMLAGPATVLVWRQGFAPSFRTLEEREARLLRLALEGATFGAICGELAGELGEDEAAAAAGALLGQWLPEGLIVGIG